MRLSFASSCCTFSLSDSTSSCRLCAPCSSSSCLMPTENSAQSFKAATSEFLARPPTARVTNRRRNLRVSRYSDHVARHIAAALNFNFAAKRASTSRSCFVAFTNSTQPCRVLAKHPCTIFWIIFSPALCLASTSALLASSALLSLSLAYRSSTFCRSISR